MQEFIEDSRTKQGLEMVKILYLLLEEERKIGERGKPHNKGSKAQRKEQNQTKKRS